MPSLDQISTAGNLKILLLGAPGSGKTCFATSLPTPILYLDFDGKVDSAALFHKADLERLKAIDVRTLTRSLPGGADPIEELNKIMKDEIGPQLKSGALKFKTLVLDSISAFSTATLKHIIRTNPGIKGVETAQGKQPDRPHYGVMLRWFTEYIPAVLDLPCNVIMCAHLETYKDANSGMIIRSPMMDGSFDEKLPIYFKEVWYTHVTDKGQYVAQTKADSKFSCLRSQIPGLPAVMPLSYAELEKYIK